MNRKSSKINAGFFTLKHTFTKSTLQSGDKPHEDATPDPKVTALGEASEQFKNALEDIKSSSGMDMAQRVISLNCEMIKNPDGDFEEEFFSIFTDYQALPEDVKNE